MTCPRRHARRIVSGVAVTWMSLAASLALPAHSAAAIAPSNINVPAARPTIQAGIDAASAGDMVVVAPGTYHERIDFKGKAIEVRSSGGPAATTIHGDDVGHVVRFRSGEGRTSTLRGFTITRGLVSDTIAGGGISIESSSPTIIGNVVRGNNAEGHSGAGIGVLQGAPLIRDNLVAGNITTSTGAGGGIFASGGAEIVHNVIEGNVAGGGGGILVATAGEADVRVIDNVIRGNRAWTGSGGGVNIAGGDPIVAQNLIVGNLADAAGGGMFWEDLGPAVRPQMLSNTIVSNVSPQGSAVMGGFGNVLFANNLVMGLDAGTVGCDVALAPAVFHHNDVYAGGAAPYAGCPDPTGTAGNISVDPRLVSSPDPTLDFRLQPGSPAIDAGDNDAVAWPSDLDGLPRTTDGDGDGTVVVDMGAYEAPTVVRRVSQIPYSVWMQPTGMTLDSIGSWFYPVNEPTAGDGQLAPAWFYAHYFGFEGGGKGQVGLVTNPDGKFAVFSMVKPDGTTLDAAVPFDWSPGQYYFPFVFPAGPGLWAAWIYDDTAGTWTEIGTHAVPPDWGRLAPASITAVSWLGPVAGDCAAYPHADVAFYAPFGFIGGVASVAGATTTAVGAGDCIPVADVQEPWARYQVGVG
jgi:hypothetical protein